MLLFTNLLNGSINIDSLINQQRLPNGDVSRCQAAQLPENRIKNRFKTTYPCKNQIFYVAEIITIYYIALLIYIYLSLYIVKHSAQN